MGTSGNASTRGPDRDPQAGADCDGAGVHTQKTSVVGALRPALGEGGVKVVYEARQILLDRRGRSNGLSYFLRGQSPSGGEPETACMQGVYVVCN